MEIVKLGEICEPKQWKTIPTKKLTNQGYPVYGANGIIGFFNSYNHEFPVIAITCRGATCGTVNMTVGKSYVTGNAMCLDNINSSILQNYLYYALKNYDFSRIITGAAQPQITKEKIMLVQIKKYDTQTQQKIVDVLDNINLLIKTKESQLALLDELVQSQFAKMFGDKEFNLCCIREVVDTNKISAKKRYKDTDEINYIDISSIDNNQNIISTYTKYIFKDAPSRAQQCLMKRDILISTVRPNLKNIALFDEEGDFVGSSGFCILRSKKCNPYFLLQVVLTDKFTDEMISLTTGASYPAIKDDDILNFKIPLPPIELQDKFASFVQQVEKSKSILNAQILQLKELLNSKMDEYFR